MTHVLKVDLTVSVILRPYLEMRIEPEVGVRVLFVPAPRWLAAFCRLVCFNHTHNVDVQVLHKSGIGASLLFCIFSLNVVILCMDSQSFPAFFATNFGGPWWTNDRMHAFWHLCHLYTQSVPPMQ